MYLVLTGLTVVEITSENFLSQFQTLVWVAGAAIQEEKQRFSAIKVPSTNVGKEQTIDPLHIIIIAE
jgi:hypothetical protein